MTTNHYNTLGLSKSATQTEIKSAYRKLCMETHPDVASTGEQAQNAERFKRISEAYSILSNETSRRQYDFDVKESMRFGGMDNLKRARSAARSSAGGGGGAAASFGSTLPRNLLIGSILGFAGVTMLRTMLPNEVQDDGHRLRNTGHKKLVEAWKNPKTNRWEKPRPWDPEYQRLQPALHFVPREDVHSDGR
eukprot:scaffold193_cov203-Alexandrium_tamarense.AAC.19